MSEVIASSAGKRRDFVVVSIVFLPSVLPTIFRDFEIPEPRQLVTAGIIVFAYGTSAAAGSYGFSRLAGRIPARRLILAQIATKSRGRTIGLINTARFAGNALGPIMAAFILSQSNLPILRLVLGAGLALAAAGNYLGTSAGGKSAEV